MLLLLLLLVLPLVSIVHRVTVSCAGCYVGDAAVVTLLLLSLYVGVAVLVTLSGWLFVGNKRIKQ